MFSNDGVYPQTRSSPSVIGKSTPMLPISTSLSTRSGCWVATRSAMAPPKLLPTIDAFGRPRLSRRPTTWSAQVCSPYWMSVGRSEKPKPTMSGAITWKDSASAGMTSRQLA